jgi:hypothetical protein
MITGPNKIPLISGEIKISAAGKTSLLNDELFYAIVHPL